MSASTSSPNRELLQADFAGDFYSRRLLLPYKFYQPPTMATPPATGNGHESLQTNAGDNSFDANVVMVLSVLLCALICSLGLNSIIRCALKCSNLVASFESGTGNASDRKAITGVKRKAVKSFPTVIFSPELNLPGLDSDCAICLTEFAAGARVRLLPKCSHGFHVRCIDKWLSSHFSCPKCRHCLIEITCEKFAGRSQASSSEQPPTVEEVAVSIAALEPEGLINTYRGCST
ncbi:RING-H2 finger protein ATL78-like [Juglans microcarpa x Juglans regia]|uniref:RING-H2 finger protein ATL78-like n=1 Tax=Juglans microcarpa x Juglans regia TaxID=2249226 RepID=UPI001B7F2590|nr:RING-H2 finger protein ATL78-like [Juglans microcarpa x Juglans regia]